MLRHTNSRYLEDTLAGRLILATALANGELSDYRRVVLGSGLVGTEFDRLIIADWSQPSLSTLSRLGYDGNSQFSLPAWNHVDIVIDGIIYSWENGEHDAVQTLDLRTGVAEVSDKWEYAPGKRLSVAIRMFLPRQQPLTGWLSLRIEGNAEKRPIRLKFGLRGDAARGALALDFSKSRGDCLVGVYRGAQESTPVEQMLSWSLEGGLIRSVKVEDDRAWTEAEVTETDGEIKLCHSLSFPESGYGDGRSAEDRARDLLAAPEAVTLRDNAEEWRSLWRDALLFPAGGRQFARDLVIWQYYLLGTLSDFPCVLGATSLWVPAWGGRQFWDADMWLFRAALLLWPKLARSIPAWRAQTLEPARENAAATNCCGGWFSWQVDGKGRGGRTLPHLKEVHNNIWVALAAWDAYRECEDPAFLRTVTWPLLAAISDYFCSRARKENDGLYHIRQVLGPNESVEEVQHTLCDDNTLTNHGVRTILDIAIDCAKRLGVDAPLKWKDVIDGLFLLGSDARGIIPEHANYNGEGIKQADLILIFYPLGYKASPEMIRANVEYYESKILNNGPMMSLSMSALLLMRCGAKEEGMRMLQNGILPFLRGPHRLLCECRDDANRNIVFHTGAGGVLQALLYGYLEADVAQTEHIPRVRNVCPDFSLEPV